MKGQRSTMYYGNTNPDKNLRTYIKSYSADGSMEIRRNTTTNAIEIITYLGGDAYSAPLMLKSDGTINTSQNFLYLHRDYQGSILTITDNVGVVQEKRLFDAWGTLIKFWNPTSNVVPTTTGIMITDRGYTGHEHLLGVGLINMNGRLYDTAFHRFLSPDNNLQEPGNTQNYNRYGYCLNNPFKYTDYAGESFWSDLGDAFTSAYHQIASGVLSIATIVLGAALVGISFAIGTAVGVIQLVGSGFKNNSILMNQTMIIGGLFQGNIGQIASRFTNELPQTLMGLGLALGVNAIGRVRSVTSYGGATAVEMYDPNWGAFTVGSYIIGEKGIQASPTNNLFKHEYGHYLQSQEAGSNYMYDYGFSSLISAGNSDRQNPHHASWTEQDANIRAINYFGSDGWDYNKFQVFGSGQNNQFDRDFGHLRRNRVRVGGGWLTLSH